MLPKIVQPPLHVVTFGKGHLAAIYAISRLFKRHPEQTSNTHDDGKTIWARSHQNHAEDRFQRSPARIVRVPLQHTTMRPFQSQKVHSCPWAHLTSYTLMALPKASTTGPPHFSHLLS